MIINKKGNILESIENIICHQCNTKGIFGGVLAYQIKQVYPKAEEDSMQRCNIDNPIGKCVLTQVNDNKYICNCFSQNEDYTTNYAAIVQIFDFILKYAKENNLSVCVPYKYGCGIAKGDWNIVLNIFNELSFQNNIDIVVYELEV